MIIKKIRQQMQKKEKKIEKNLCQHINIKMIMIWKIK